MEAYIHFRFLLMKQSATFINIIFDWKN